MTSESLTPVSDALRELSGKVLAGHVGDIRKAMCAMEAYCDVIGTGVVDGYPFTDVERGTYRNALSGLNVHIDYLERLASALMAAGTEAAGAEGGAF